MWWTAWLACAEDPGKGPGNPEPLCVDEVAYDGVDQDCDGADLVDVDGDGEDAEVAGGRDCDDDDASVHPGAGEVPYDGIDQNCRGGDLVDVDGDGEDALAAGGDDCDDGDDTIAPGQPDDAGDGIDRNCDGVDGEDADGDGFADWRTGGNDCDDADATRNLDAEEVWYDGVDQDCDRTCDYDQDGDGAVLTGSPVANGDRCDQQVGPAAGAPDDCDDSDASVVWISITEQDPRSGQVGVPVDAPITVRLSQPDPTAALTLTDDGGIPISGTSSVAGDLVTFVPAAALAPSQRLDATLTWRCDSTIWEFQTTAGPVDPASLAGAAWELDLGSATWTEPAALGPLIGALGVAPLTLTVAGVGPDTLDLRLGGPSPQDRCVPTTELPGATFVDNPRVSFQAAAVTWDLSGYAAVVTDMEFSADLATSALTNGALRGDVDTRPLVDLIAPGGAPDAVCQLVLAFGVACQACPGGAGTYCLTMAAEDIDGAPVAAFDPISEADVAADPACP